MKPRTLLALFTTLLALLGNARAALTLPCVFGDHMVLQAGQPAPVWGWAAPGEKISVRFGAQEKSTTAGPDGRWEIRLDPLAVSVTPAALTVVAGAETRTFADVLVGEVWLCSGQSNMEKPIGAQPGQLPVVDSAFEIAAADFPAIRLLKIKKTKAAAPARDVESSTWTVCSPTSIEGIRFSAAGYFFGRKLHRELGVPVGLIDSSWGGTRIEPWTSPAGFAAVPALTDFSAAATTPGAKLEGSELGTLYCGMIAPLAPFALRGALWYQGESNVVDAPGGTRYAAKMAALLAGWRTAFGREFSFYYVQIAPYLYHVQRPSGVTSPQAAPLVWEAQADAQRLPRTGMIVVTDLTDDIADIHPRNKKDVGERLARWALAKDYGQSGLEVSGPVFRELKISGPRAVLHFDHLGGGLVATGGKSTLSWFTLAGADGYFYPTTAVVEGETVVVTSPLVPAPVAVRFAWDEAARPNFANAAGLPAVPFRTDRPATKP